MKAWLVLQEGPGAGTFYPLDPLKKPVLSVGRSSECDIVLDDHRASRHHSDIRWNGRQWEVVDRGSTNGTYVNGMQVHQPYDLRLGDRVTIGETTLVLRGPSYGPGDPSATASGLRPGTASGLRPGTASGLRAPTSDRRPAKEPVQAAPPGGAMSRPVPGRLRDSTPGRLRDSTPEQLRGSKAQGAPHERISAGVMVAFWLVQGAIAVAVVCLAAGAFLPWLRVTGTLSQDLGPLLQSITGVVSYFMGTDSFFHFTQDISGLAGYGKLTLGIAIIGMIGLIVDIFSVTSRRSVGTAIVYLLSGLIVSGAMASDLVNFYRFYKQAESWSLLFGIQLGDIIEILDRFVEMQITPLPGLPLTVVGLVLVIVGGVGRLIVALLSRKR